MIVLIKEIVLNVRRIEHSYVIYVDLWIVLSESLWKGNSLPSSARQKNVAVMGVSLKFLTLKLKPVVWFWMNSPQLQWKFLDNSQRGFPSLTLSQRYKLLFCTFLEVEVDLFELRRLERLDRLCCQARSRVYESTCLYCLYLAVKTHENGTQFVACTWIFSRRHLLQTVCQVSVLTQQEQIAYFLYINIWKVQSIQTQINRIRFE